jgi:outer membrane protein assembly factor BamA
MTLIRHFAGFISCFLASISALAAQTPGATPVAPGPEIVAEIRTHGNVRIADEEIVRVAGIQLGQPLQEHTLEEIETRLRKSGRFDEIEVRKRYRSLEDFSQVALLLIVHERLDAGGSPLTRPLRKIRSRVMFLPILKYDDGYGWTYGVHSSTSNLLGIGERLSVPLTLGATKSAALELERSFEDGPLTRIQSSFGISSQTNPGFLLTDRRVEWNARAERKIRVLRLGGEAGHSNVRFGSLDDRFWTFGGNTTIDTRIDPAFPANAVYAFGGWRALNRAGGQPRIGIIQGDLRGYWRPAGQAVIAARVQYEGANRRLPDYERLLVGGASTLRGTRVATFIGDRALAASAELRVPITSPLRFGRFGATLFVDSAKTYDAGQRPADVPWSSGAGAGLFMIVPFVSINVHFARSLDGAGNRLHLSTGFTF